MGGTGEEGKRRNGEGYKGERKGRGRGREAMNGQPSLPVMQQA